MSNFKNDSQRKAVMANLNNGASSRQNVSKATLKNIKNATKQGWVSTKDGRLGVLVENGVVSISSQRPFASSSLDRDAISVRLDELEPLINKAKGDKPNATDNTPRDFRINPRYQKSLEEAYDKVYDADSRLGFGVFNSAMNKMETMAKDVGYEFYINQSSQKWKLRRKQ